MYECVYIYIYIYIYTHACMYLYSVLSIYVSTYLYISTYSLRRFCDEPVCPDPVGKPVNFKSLPYKQTSLALKREAHKMLPFRSL